MTLHEELGARLEALSIDPGAPPTAEAWAGLLEALDDGFHLVDHERALLRAQLADARREAQAATEAKRNFLATVGHELRTPLNGILGMGSLLQGTALTPEQEEYAEAIRRSAGQLVALVEQILEFPRLAAGRLELLDTPFYLPAMLGTLAEFAGARARERGLEFAALIYRDLPPGVHGDLNRLRQVLLHVLDNAIKFTERGEVLLRVRPLAATADEVLVRFEVADTGIGLDAEACARAFEPFAQGDASPTRPFPGTGLGLATTQRVVALMGGRMGLTSEPGRGTLVWIELPLRPAVLEGAPAGAPGDLAGARALVVACNPARRTTLHHELTPLGMPSVVAPDGPAALELLRGAARRGTPFEVVLLDALAADGEVLALAEAVQADPALAGLPVVLLASMGLDAQGAALRRRGVAAWSSKPVAAAQLHECLRRLLASAPAPVAPPPAPEVPAPAPPAGKLLIVEDNAVNQKVALGIVKQLGFEADLAVHGLNALEALGHDRYDAVLMDCQMPVMDGYQATREIRLREGGRRRLPIIAFTANADQGDRERCLEAGMDDYITKPVRPDELRTTIERWVRPPEPCVDPEVIESLRALQGPGEPDLVAELVALFEQDGPAALAQLRAAVAARDVALAKQTAHTLKGCAANIGAKGLAERCALLEREAERPDPGLVAGIAMELDHVLVALRRLAAPAHA